MDGPWADYASPQQASPAAQGPWADYAAPDAQSSAPAQPVGLTKDEQQAVLRYLPKAKSPEDLDAFARNLTRTEQYPQGRVGINNAAEVLKDYGRTKRKVYNFTEDPYANDTAPEPTLSWRDYLKGAAEHAGHGLVSGLGFIDDAINPFAHAKETYRDVKDLLGGYTPDEEKQISAERAGPGFFQKGADAAYVKAHPDVAKPAANTGQRYLNNVAEFAGGAAIPMGEFNGVRGIAGLTAAAVGGGVANQAAQDVFPDNPLIQNVAGLVGAHVGGTPFALKPVRDNVYVSKAAEHPEAAYVPGAAQALADKAADVAPNGLTPKGRGKLTVTQINRTATKPLLGMTDDLNRLVKAGQLDADKARTLKLAIENKDGITKPEIDALRGTPEGDATAEALSHYRAVQNLTKPFGGDGRGALTKLWNYTVPKALPKLLGDAVTIKPGDVNAARIRGADKAIDRLPVYNRLADKVGPSGLSPALDTFQKKVADTFQADKDAQAQAAADTAAKADAKAARSGMTPTEDVKYSVREASAGQALNSEPVPAPRKATVRNALNKYQKAADTGSSKLADFDAQLNAPPPAPKAAKESPMDKVVRANIEQGVQGNYNSYADTLGVNRDDVLRALKGVKTDDVPPLEIDKLVHGYKLSPAGRAALIPRLQKALTEDGTIAARANEAAAPKEAPKATPNATAAPAETGLHYKYVRRPANHAEGKANYQGAFDKARTDLSSEKSPHSQEIVAAAQDGLDHIRNGEKTTEGAMRYFDEQLGPRLRKQGFVPEEISDLRSDVENMATVGKPYRTQAEFEKGALTKGPGRKPKPKPKPSDDVPF